MNRLGFHLVRMALLLLSGILLLGPAKATSDEMRHFEIPAQSLNNALLQFAAETHLELIFTADNVRGLKVDALSGDMTEEQALSKLLHGSGYSYRYIDADTLTLIPDTEPVRPDTEEYVLEVPIKPERTQILKPMLVIGQGDEAGRLAAARRKTYQITHSRSATRTDTHIKNIPQSIQALPQTLISDQQSLTISESLRNISGVTISPVLLTPSFDFTRIRGFRAEQLLDGFTQYYNPGDRESLVNVERIEVLKGSNALLYGGGSGSPAGGLVNIVSKLPHREPSGEIGLKYGSYDYYQPWFDLNQPVNDRLWLRITGEFTQAKSSIDVVETQRYNINPAMILTDNDNTTVTLQGKFSKWEQADYQGLPVTGAIAGDFSIHPETYIGPKTIEPSRAEFYGLWGTLAHTYDETWSVNLKTRYSESSFDQKTQLLYGSDGVQADVPLLQPSTWGLLNSELYQKQQEFSFVGNALAQFDIGPTENKLLLGGDYSRFCDDGFIESDALPVAMVDLRAPIFSLPYNSPGTGENNVFVTNMTYGAFLQLQSSWYERIHFLTGLRLANVTIDYQNRAPGFTISEHSDTTKLLPKVGAVFDLTDSISLFASYSRGMRGQPFVNFSAAPQPELSRQLEGGLKFDVAELLSGQLAVYQIDREQVAVTDNNDPQRRSVTTGKQRSQGIEADLLWQAGDSLSILTSYAFSRAQYLANHPDFADGTPISGIPEHSGRLWANYRFFQSQLSTFSMGAGVYAQSRAPLDVPGVPWNYGFYSVDAAINYETDHAKFSLSGKNLTNQHYFEYLNYFGGRVSPVQPLSLYFNISLRY